MWAYEKGEWGEGDYLGFKWGCLSDAMDKERSMRQNYIYISVYSFLNKAFVLI